MTPTKQLRLDQLKLKRDQLSQRIQKMEALEKQRDRKKDTRRKLLVGAYYLNQIKKDGAMHMLIKKLDTFLTRNSDRALFNLPPLDEE